MIRTPVLVRPKNRASVLRLLAVLFALLAFGTVVRYGGTEEPKEQAGTKKPTLGDIIDQTSESVVQISAQTTADKELGIGTGFVVDVKGLVATNYHVLRGATKAVVQFKNGKKYSVKGLRALDADADLAILELERPPEKLKALPLASKTPPRQGEDVIAIGHPQGLNFSVTTGIVSAVRKKDQLPKEIAEQLSGADKVWIQTSAAISPGNSGGPLLDGQGRVIGINTWIVDGQSLGCAIHVGHLRTLLEKPSKELLPLSIPKFARDVENPFASLEPRIEQMLKDFQSAQHEFELALLRAPDEKTKLKIVEDQDPAPKYAQRFCEIANAERKTTVALQALILACRLDFQSKEPRSLKQALNLLGEDHATDKGIYHALVPVRQTGHPAAADFFRKVVAKHADRKTRGLSSLLLATLLNNQGDKNEAEVVRLLESCTKDYGNVALGNQTLGELAKPLLFRIRFLSVGKRAPEITAADSEDKKFRLSDYRGKVVLLDFFADWCPHCERMYPYERQLIKDYAGRPFVLLGVNCDKGKDTLRQLIAAKKVTWRCWWDNEDSPITQDWQITAFPTLYLIDSDGVIREILLGRPDEKKLDEAIKRWVELAEKKR